MTARQPNTLTRGTARVNGYRCKKSPTGRHASPHQQLFSHSCETWCLHCGRKVRREHSRSVQWTTATYKSGDVRDVL